jgi:hypothetical protein
MARVQQLFSELHITASTGSGLISKDFSGKVDNIATL